MIKRTLLVVLLGFFVCSCKTRHTVTYGKRSTTAEIEPKRKVAPQNEAAVGSYALPEDNGKFMRYEIHSVDAYIDFFAETAQLEMKAYGIPASITLAQGLLESGLGKGELALKSNNHFGIKCHTGWTGDYVLYDDDAKGECFRKYNHPMYSYRDHSIFLSGRSRYASLFKLDKNDYKAWARGLQKAGYATDRKYPNKLIALIERYDLYRYDDVEVDFVTKNEIEDVSWSQENGDKAENQIPETIVGESIEMKASKPEIPKKNKKEASNAMVHKVVRGDSLWALSRKYGVTISQLREWNRLSSSALSIGQELIVKNK